MKLHLYRTGLAIASLTLTMFGCVDAADEADDTSSDEAALVTHPDDDTAGSQILLHEGADSIEYELAVTQTPGMDVSGYQGTVNWSSAHAKGARFAYIKATESTTYRNPSFGAQYTGSYNAGIIHGAYHFATPNTSSGATQANYFVSHGGGWSADGKTLPPAVDLEYNPYGSTCYGKSHASMVAWIRDFVNTVKARTGRDAVIYTSTSWWSLCTGNNASFGNNPLWVARYSSSAGTLPASWSYYTIWQNADHGAFPGDHDYFNGAADRLRAFAL